MPWIDLTALSLVAGCLLTLGLSFLIEGERRAASRAAICLALVTAAWIGVLSLPVSPLSWGLRIAFLTAALAPALAALPTWFPKSVPPDLSGLQRYDERDHMFARNNTWNYPELAEKYYQAHPDRLESDRRIQEKPRLGEPGGRFYDPLLTPVATAAFELLGRTRSLAQGVPAAVRQNVPPAEMTRLLRDVGRLYGAADIGICRLRDCHLYSHAGRHAANWGQPIEKVHAFAVVIVVAMDHQLIRHAPAAPVMVESSRQYVESAKIAHLLAGLIREFGHEARAHVDGDYEVLGVPLARDAGLGAVGRLSLLMHPVHGPCVRLAAVTTEMELVETPAAERDDIAHFCRICRKCAHNCPAAAIPKAEMPVERGFAHWTVRQEACYSFWRAAGTDCALCVRVCPFSKPDTLIHRVLRWYVGRNPITQWLALRGDDLFYGRRCRVPEKGDGPPKKRRLCH